MSFTRPPLPPWLVVDARDQRETARWTGISIAGSDVDADPAAADSAVCDGDTAASSDALRGLYI